MGPTSESEDGQGYEDKNRLREKSIERVFSEKHDAMKMGWRKVNHVWRIWTMAKRTSDDKELREQERRLKNTTAQRVFYIAALSIIVLLSIVGILGSHVFHFW